MDTTNEPEWKKIQRRLAERSKKVFALLPQFNKPGSFVTTQSGTKYQIMSDGSWRKLIDARQ